MQATLCKFGRLWKNRNFEKIDLNIVSTTHGDFTDPPAANPLPPPSFPAQVLKYLDAYIINYLWSIWPHFSPCSCETVTCNETLPNSTGRLSENGGSLHK